VTQAAPPGRPPSFPGLPPLFPRAHQLQLLANVARRRSTLLIAPTGAGKTLANFLPSLVALAQRAPLAPTPSVHTLYVSPLKALASDVARNLIAPISEIGLPVTVETRTGDTPIARKQRQRQRPPDLLLTTPEQVALLLSHADAARLFAVAIWCLQRQGRLDLDALFAEDMLGDDLEAWLAESNLMRRTFRLNAVIAGLIERRHLGRTKNARQVTVSSDLIYDVLRKHDPHHILLQAAWEDAATGLLDMRRLGEFLRRIKGRIRYKALSHVSPLAVPALLEIGQELINARGVAHAILREATEALVGEAMQAGE
jgi:Lhr-like helicase